MAQQAIISLVAVMGLSGCSSAFDIRATVIGGKVAFVPADTDWWGNPDPDCFYSIAVMTRDGPPATPKPGDSADMVKNGVYWNQTFAVTSCENAFPIVYGASLKGPPFREGDESIVKAKPLIRGVVYEVSAAGNGSAYGGGKFMINSDGKVVNVPS